ncbi:MAG: thioesterase family protein [Acidimicrobiales bacterium]
MGDLAADTTLTPAVSGTFTATLSRDWEIWGPNGGYMAAFAVQAARAVTARARPANATVHFLGAASFDAPIEVTTTVQRATRQATSVHVRIDQSGKPVLAAMVWAVDAGIDGLEHDDAPMPAVPSWRELPTMDERIAADPDTPRSRHRFWDNFEQRPVTWLGSAAWEQREPEPAIYENWLRFASPAAGDEWAQAARLLLLVDLGAWPSIGRRHRTEVWMAPSIDVSCEFHHLDPTDDWCLLVGTSPAARDGLIGSHQRVWNERGDLVASGISHLLCRRVG